MADKIDPGKFKAISKAKAKPSPIALENGKLMVQKDDGSIAQWGNDVPEIKNTKQYRLHPQGSINQDDFDYLKSLNDSKVNYSLARNIASPTEVPLYGQQDSDLIKNMLAKRVK